jgi:hypothetical protein
MMLRQQQSEHQAVLKRHGGTLTEKWKHGMSGIAEKRDPPLRPSGKRRPIKQSPLEAGVGLR